jgi:hypothetical protein
MARNSWANKHAGDSLFKTPPWEKVPLREQLARKQMQLEQLDGEELEKTHGCGVSLPITFPTIQLKKAVHVMWLKPLLAISLMAS